MTAVVDLTEMQPFLFNLSMLATSMFAGWKGGRDVWTWFDGSGL